MISAPDAAAFEHGNVAGTLAMLAAATAGGVPRFVHVSSLAAREPKLSLYGASKAKAEELVQSSGLDWAIVRPPAVYGPGDKETLELFRMARRGRIYLPPAGKLSLIHVEDLAELLLALARHGAPEKIVIEPDDGRKGGWTHREFGDALGRAVGVRARTISTPRFVLALGSRLDRLLRRGRAKLTPDRVAYFCHPDWVARRGTRRTPGPVAPAHRNRTRPRRHRAVVSGAGLAVDRNVRFLPIPAISYSDPAALIPSIVWVRNRAWLRPAGDHRGQKHRRCLNAKTERDPVVRGFRLP